MTASTDSTDTNGPLAGYRIIELTANMTAPLGGMWLGDQGADVIKIEPFSGDQFRNASTSRAGVEGMASVYANCNRNKRSLRLDLKKPGGAEAFKELVKTADVVLQNYRPGVMDRMGLGYEDLKTIKNDIIMVSVNGFGSEGPYAEQRVYDTVIQGIAGIAVAQTNHDTGMPNVVQFGVVDTLTSLNVFQGITAALLAKERTGKGQHVQINMLQAALAFVWPGVMSHVTLLGDNVHLRGNGTTLRLVFQTKDHFVVMLALSNDEWRGVCTAAGKEHLITDPRFKDMGARASHFADQYEELKDAFKHKTTDEWLLILKELDVPYARVNTPENVHLDPQVIASKLLVDLEHPHAGPYRQPIHAINFSETPASIRRHAPMLGEHSNEILGEAGLSAVQIEELRKNGVI